MFQTTVDPAYTCDEWQPDPNRSPRMNAIDERAVWSTAYMNDLPDSAFLIIEKGGKKDQEGKTTPRSLRHFPVRDANGNVDLAHVRNALSRIPQSNLSAELKAEATRKAQRLLGDSEPDADDSGGPSDNDADDRTLPANWELRYVTAPITHIDVRDPSQTGDGCWTMSGYAAVFNQQTVLHDGNLVRVSETIDPAAFDTVLRDQGIGTPEGVIHLNIGHDMNRCIAATDVPAGQEGSLQLRADAHGLGWLARVAKDDPDAISAASKLRTGVFKQGSFAMRIKHAEETSRQLPDGRYEDHARIMEIGRVRDVCIAAQGAYTQTLSQLRTMAAALGEPGQHEPGRHPREPDLGREAVEPTTRTSDGGAARRTPLEALIAPRQRQHYRRTP